MTHVDHTETAVNRRHLLRGGAVLAGAAGATVIGAALAPTGANAADTDGVTIGAENEGASSTTLTLVPAGPAASLTLANEGGPSLRLTSVGDDFTGELQTGEIVNTDSGPLIGVDYGPGTEVDIIATGYDLSMMPVSVPMPPARLLDTRKASGRTGIVRQSSMSALTSGKLKAGQWIDVAVESAEEYFTLYGVHGTAAVIDPEKNGYLIVYPPSDTVPATSNINFRAGVNLSNAVFVAIGVFDGNYVVRIWTSQTTHLLFDLSGVVYSATERPSSEMAGRRASRQTKQLAKMRKTLSR